MDFFRNKMDNETARFIWNNIEHRWTLIVTIAFAVFVVLMFVVNSFMFIARFLLNMEFPYIPIYNIVAGVGGFLAAGFFSMYDLGVVNTKYQKDLDKIRAKYIQEV